MRHAECMRNFLRQQPMLPLHPPNLNMHRSCNRLSLGGPLSRGCYGCRSYHCRCCSARRRCCWRSSGHSIGDWHGHLVSTFCCSRCIRWSRSCCHRSSWRCSVCWHGELEMHTPRLRCGHWRSVGGVAGRSCSTCSRVIHCNNCNARKPLRQHQSYMLRGAVCRHMHCCSAYKRLNAYLSALAEES